MGENANSNDLLRLGVLAGLLAANYTLPATAGNHCTICEVNPDTEWGPVGYCIGNGGNPPGPGNMYDCQTGYGWCIGEESTFNVCNQHS